MTPYGQLPICKTPLQTGDWREFSPPLRKLRGLSPLCPDTQTRCLRLICFAGAPKPDSGLPILTARVSCRSHFVTSSLLEHFARHFNLTHRSCGHVWQARYFSCPLDRAHFWQAMAYVERNPVRARLLGRAEDYRWSSAGARLGKTAAPDFLELKLWRETFTPEQWAGVLGSPSEEIEFGERLADAAIRGRPLGNADFLADLEKQAGRRLRAKPVGRPKIVVRKDEGQMELEIGI